MRNEPTASGLLSLPGEAQTLLAEAVLALRTTADLGVSWGVAAAHAKRALAASDSRLLRVDRKSGVVDTLRKNTGRHIVGAGASSCAPLGLDQ